MAAFSLRVDLAEEVNRYFLENDYGDQSFFLLLSTEKSISLGKINMGQFSVLSKKQSSETWIRDYNHGAIIRIYMV